MENKTVESFIGSIRLFKICRRQNSLAHHDCRWTIDLISSFLLFTISYIIFIHLFYLFIIFRRSNIKTFALISLPYYHFNTSACESVAAIEGHSRCSQTHKRPPRVSYNHIVISLLLVYFYRFVYVPFLINSKFLLIFLLLFNSWTHTPTGS